MSAVRLPVAYENVVAAGETIAGRLHRTPTFSTVALGERVGARVFLKAELFQKTGSFKPRGVLNNLAALSPEERARGVISISAGNHAQALAWGAASEGLDALIVMWQGASEAKIEATRGYGAAVDLEARDPTEAFERLAHLQEHTGRALVHPFDHPLTIAGQGTVGLEIVEEWPQVEAIVVPLGGGGLLSGVAVSATTLKPKVEVFGVEPRAGNDGEQSFRSGKIVTIEPPNTIADGARTLAIGVRNFAIIRERVRNVVSVDDEALLEAVKFAMYRTKLVIEPTGALGIAALLTRMIVPKGPTAVVVSGGNLDFSLLCR